MDRRTLLKFAGGAVLNGALVGSAVTAALMPANATTRQVSTPVTAPQALPPRDVRQMAFINTHTGERFADAYWEAGNYVPDAMAAINQVMRDHRSGEVHTIDPALIDQLHSLHGLVEATQPFQIISGYRSPASNASLRAHSNGVASRSLHMDGKAIDIRIAGVELTNLRDAALGMQAGGVGYYAASDFIHVDTGRVRRW